MVYHVVMCVPIPQLCCLVLIFTSNYVDLDLD